MTQEQIALNCIEYYGYIDRPLAFQEGIANITAVISELRKKGHQIETKKTPYINAKGENKERTEWIKKRG